MTTGHDFDIMTHFCLKCGVARKDVLERDLACVSGNNVIAVSHIISQRRLGELTGTLYEAWRQDR